MPFVFVFQFDPEKSRANKAKHGIDFMEGQAIWDDEHRIELPARSTTEPRRAVIGQIQTVLWAAFVTTRDEETIRIISIRRARRHERAQYDRARGERDDR